MTKYGYATYREAESWLSIDGETREEAARNAFKECDDAQTVYVGEQRPIDKLRGLTRALDGDNLLEAADEIACEDAPWWDDSLYVLAPDAKAELERLLHEAAAAWLAKYPGPNVWQIENVTEHQRMPLPSAPSEEQV